MATKGFIVGILLLMTAQASGKENSSPIGKAFAAFFDSRTYLGYAETELKNFVHPAIPTAGKMKSWFAGSDSGFPIAIHIGMRETYTQEAQISFNGAPPERGEMYFSVGEIGLKVFLPVPVFQFWAGAGYVAGFGSINNPQTRGNHSYLAAFENETQGVWGSYAHAGLDIMISKKLGIRGFYQEDFISTSQYHTLQSPGLYMNVKQIGVAIVGRGI